MLIERGYVLLHKIKVQQSRKIRKREKEKNLASILGKNLQTRTDNAKNLKRNVTQTREQHNLKALATFNNISKSNYNYTYRENNRKIRHNSERRILCCFFSLPCN